MAICHVNLVSHFFLVYLLHLYQKRMFQDMWHRLFFMSQMPFVSILPNQRHQSTDIGLLYMVCMLN